MKKLLKKLVIILFCVMMITPTPVQASTAKDRRAAKNVVYDFLESANAYKQKDIAKCFQSEKYRKKFKLFSSKSMSKLIRSYNRDHFYYKITNVSLKKNKGTVTAKVHYCDLGMVYDAAVDYIRYEWYPYNQDASQKEIEAAYADAIDSAYSNDDDSPSYSSTTVVKIPVIKRKGKWKIAKMTGKMQEVISCNLLMYF